MLMQAKITDKREWDKFIEQRWLSAGGEAQIQVWLQVYTEPFFFFFLQRKKTRVSLPFVKMMIQNRCWSRIIAGGKGLLLIVFVCFTGGNRKSEGGHAGEWEPQRISMKVKGRGPRTILQRGTVSKEEETQEVRVAEELHHTTTKNSAVTTSSNSTIWRLCQKIHSSKYCSLMRADEHQLEAAPIEHTLERRKAGEQKPTTRHTVLWLQHADL